MLCLVSILVVYSSTGTLAYKQAGGNTFYYLSKQLMFVGVSLLTVFIVHRANYKIFYNLAKLLYYASIPLLLYTLVRGVSINEAARWITLPGGFSFQTSDFAKMALMMYLAAQISQKQPEIKDLKKGVVPLLIPIGLTCMLILPANLSTSLLVFISSMVLLFIGRVQTKHIALLAGIGAVGVGIFILVALNSPDTGRIGTWKRRIENYISKDGENFQADQAKIAVATGGMFGKGPGQSVQRNILPHPYSDFIFAIIIEEYGLITGIFIMSLYLILLFRSVALIRKCPTTFPAFLVAGMVILIVLQAFTHISVNIGFFPVTGQTLPMISMGGTSMIINGIQIGIILSVSKEILKQNMANEPSEQTNDTDNEVQDEGNVTDKIID